MLTIEHPLTGEKLQIANQDFYTEMNWQEAKKACANLGSGWRLPTIEELQEMHEQLHKNGKGNFKSKVYWSGTERDASEAWLFGFYNGMVGYYDKDNPNGVRAVRAL